MKPLTIEELKALEVDDWVWVVILQDAYRPNDVPYGEYHCIYSTMNPYYFIFGEGGNFEYKFAYSDYGTKWLAYKNKEQAEYGEESAAMYDSMREVIRSACNREGIAKRCPERIATALANAGFGNLAECRKELVQVIFQDLLECMFFIYKKDAENLDEVLIEQFERLIKDKAKEYGVEVCE